MNFGVDELINFEASECQLCGKEDRNWYFMQLLADGDWRRLEVGKTMREQGLDEIDATRRIYCIHGCTEAIIRTFTTEGEMTSFLMGLRERRGRK